MIKHEGTEESNHSESSSYANTRKKSSGSTKGENRTTSKSADKNLVESTDSPQFLIAERQQVYQR
jgi:hypothetical protein